MSIIKRGNSKYWYIQFQLNGKTYIRSSRTISKKSAEQMEVEWKAQIHAQQFLGHKERITLSSAIEMLCDSKLGTPNHRNLLSFARVVLKYLPGQKYLDELTSYDLERHRQMRVHQGVSIQTIKHDLILVRGAWKLARKLGYRVDDLEFPSLKVPRSSLRYLSEDEERRLLACLDPYREGPGLRSFCERSTALQQSIQDAYDLVVMLLDTGARYSEIANIEWARIHLTTRTIHLWRPKVQNESVLYMTDRVHNILSRRRDTSPDNTYVFCNKAGGPRGYASIAIRKAIKRAGLVDCKIHTLRHTHASRLIQNGLNVYEVKEVLGHTDIKTTMRYAHLESRQVTSKARDVINRLNQGHEKQE